MAGTLPVLSGVGWSCGLLLDFGDFFVLDKGAGGGMSAKFFESLESPLKICDTSLKL